MGKPEINELDGLAGIYDLIKSGADQSELDEQTLLFKDIEQRYNKENFIEEGGMKTVQADFDAFCERSVARAGLKKGAAGDFIREARILARLEHSNIVPLYDLGLDENDQPYFTMRLLGGENLRSVLQRLGEGDEASLSTYSLDTLLEVFLKICDAIAYSHTKNVLHLDLKPANIQIDDFGEVLVCDWGLAKIINSDETVVLDRKKSEASEESELKGTPGYMAPEVYCLKRKELSPAADIYSLGVLLYELLTYESPFVGHGLEELKQKTLQADYLSPRERKPKLNIPVSLNAVVVKAMSLKANERYASVQALAREVRDYKSGFATEAEQASFLKLMGLFIKRYQRLSIAALVFLISLSLTVSYFLVELKKEKRQVEQALEKSIRSEAMAKASRRDAQASEQEAILLVKALKEEKAERVKLRKKVSPQLLKMAKEYQNAREFHLSRFLSHYIVNLDAELQEARYLAALSSFGYLDFKKAHELLKSYSGKLDATWLKKKAAVHSQERPSVQDLYKLTQDAQGLSPGVKKSLNLNLVYGVTEKLPLQQRLDFAKLIVYKPKNKNSFFDLKKRSDGYALSLRDNKSIGDIYCLRKLPLRSLDLTNTPVTNLSPVEDVALKELYLSGSRVVEIHQLNTSRLERIDLRNTLVSNLMFLKNSGIRKVYMNNLWTDLSPLSSCQSLEMIELPKNLYSPKILKKWGLEGKAIFREGN